jgi:hypothetical protein
VANFSIGARLVGLDMTREARGALVVCPMDLSDPTVGTPTPPPPMPYLVVLDRDYETGRVRPRRVARSPRLADFENNPGLESTTDPFQGGAVVDYHRVGKTPLVVVLRHRYPWPFNWALDARVRRGVMPLILLLAIASATLVVRRRAPRPTPPPGPASRAEGEPGA